MPTRQSRRESHLGVRAHFKLQRQGTPIPRERKRIAASMELLGSFSHTVVATPYELSKLGAEPLALEANTPTFLTVALRLHLASGERDKRMAPNQPSGVFFLSTTTPTFTISHVPAPFQRRISSPRKALQNPNDHASAEPADGETPILTRGKTVHLPGQRPASSDARDRSR